VTRATELVTGDSRSCGLPDIASVALSFCELAVDCCVLLSAATSTAADDPLTISFRYLQDTLLARASVAASVARRDVKRCELRESDYRAGAGAARRAFSAGVQTLWLYVEGAPLSLRAATWRTPN